MKGLFEVVRIDKLSRRTVLVRTKNLVVIQGYQHLARLTAGDRMASQTVDRMQLGTGTDAPVATDTVLQSPITPIKTIGAVTYPTAYSVCFTAYLLAAEGNGFPISEAGLLAENNDLVARVVFSSQTKTSDYQFTFHWTIQM